MSKLQTAGTEKTKLYDNKLVLEITPSKASTEETEKGQEVCES